jgi:hypothetical protein
LDMEWNLKFSSLEPIAKVLQVPMLGQARPAKCSHTITTVPHT